MSHSRFASLRIIANYLFHRMKHFVSMGVKQFVSYVETVCFSRQNTLFHTLKHFSIYEKVDAVNSYFEVETE